jgi:hypothetical protein
MYSPHRFLSLALYGGELSALRMAVPFPGNGPLDRKLIWPQSSSGCRGGEENILRLSRVELLIVPLTASNIIVVPTELSRLSKYIQNALAHLHT